MNRTLRLEPLGITLEAPAGTALRDLLFPYGVEFPCGGRGTCGRCRVRTESGEVLLACGSHLDRDLTIHIGGWEDSILTSHAAVGSRSGVGRGIAIDLGTTTVVAQLVDGSTGETVATRAERNEQAAFGADVMTRIEYALTAAGRETLQDRAVNQVRRLARELSTEPVPVVIAGNTAMHHLFGGIDVTPLAQAPFEPLDLSELRLDPNVRFLPPLGGFVGSDILAGIVATGMHLSDDLQVLLDLGTNGEIVVGTRRELLCASTAAGPAFEGGRISCGMRAATGAVSGIAADGSLEVIGGKLPPRGICGSGLVDVVARALGDGHVASSGRILTSDRQLGLTSDIALRQSDIRELQLAKGAIAAGLNVLLARAEATPRDVRRLYIAGAFGNYVRQTGAWRIGLLPFDDSRVVPVGNASLAGARLLLFGSDEVEEIRQLVRHIPLHADAGFQDAYVQHMQLCAI